MYINIHLIDIEFHLKCRKVSTWYEALCCKMVACVCVLVVLMADIIFTSGDDVFSDNLATKYEFQSLFPNKFSCLLPRLSALEEKRLLWTVQHSDAFRNRCLSYSPWKQGFRTDKMLLMKSKLGHILNYYAKLNWFIFFQSIIKL